MLILNTYPFSMSNKEFSNTWQKFFPRKFKILHLASAYRVEFSCSAQFGSISIYAKRWTDSWKDLVFPSKFSTLWYFKLHSPNHKFHRSRYLCHQNHYKSFLRLPGHYTFAPAQTDFQIFPTISHIFSTHHRNKMAESYWQKQGKKQEHSSRRLVANSYQSSK